MKILIIAEYYQDSLKQATLHTITAAKQLGDDIDLLVIGDQNEAVVKMACKVAGIKRVLWVNSSEYSHQLAENTAALLADIGKDYDYILAPATTFGKNLLPRVAALLDVAMISDIIQIKGPDIFVRPIY